MPSARKATSYRFTEKTQDLIVRLSEDMGVSQVAVIEVAVRDLAKARGLTSGPHSDIEPSNVLLSDLIKVLSSHRKMSEFEEWLRSRPELPQSCAHAEDAP